MMSTGTSTIEVGPAMLFLELLLLLLSRSSV